MRSRAALLGATIVVVIACHGEALAQRRYQATGQTIGCASPRAAAALSGSDHRRSDPNWVRFVMDDGHCTVVASGSRWALVKPGTEMLLRNLVPGNGQQLYVPRIDLRELPPEAPAPDPTRGLPIAGQETFTVGRVGRANRTLKVEHTPGGAMRFDFDEWTDSGANFSVSGVATHVGSGWQYRDGIGSADPAARCGVNLDPRPDGGYDISTVDGARCEALAGHNAVLYGVDTFPGASRTAH